MSYEVFFEKGSLKGKSWRIPDGATLTIGRSHTCAIRPLEPDVSGKHVILAALGGKVWLEAVSAHRTSVDGARLAAGDRRELTARSSVSLGNAVAFRIREANAEAETETSVFSAAGVAEGATATVATVATRATMATRAAAADETEMLGSEAVTGLGETAATAATRAAQTRAFARGAATRNLPDETGTVPTGAIPEESETQMLATQVVTPAEIERLRSEHIRLQRRKIGIKSVVFLTVLGVVFGLYLWLSNPTVNPYLVAPSKISFNGVIRTSDGAIGITVPNIRGGAPTYADDHQVRYETRLGDKWEVPYTIILTNYYDRQSLYESAEASFARWRKANMKGLWVDRGESDRRHIFLGGKNGAYPGIPCLQHNYSNVGEDRENISGTATFFRIGPRCYVLLRELPTSEDGRGAAWLTEVWATLYVQGNPENLIVAHHWEGTEEADDKDSPAEIAKECKDALRSGAQNKWERIRKRLYVAMRMLEGRNDADSAATRSQILDALQLLRQEQGNFWNESALKASQYFNSPRDDVQKRMDEVKRSLKTYFKAPDDERTWILETEYWWLYRGVGE